jgi:tetratricopeptide (TPR) repeat protein
MWEKLFDVLDAGEYGQAKIHYDPSMRLYAQDLELGQRAASWAGWTLEEGIAYLPHLWRYTLLRCSLASLADNYPTEAFQLLLLLDQETKALGLAELLTNPSYKVEIFTLIATHIAKQSGREKEGLQLFIRAREIATSISDPDAQAEALSSLGQALAQAHHLDQAKQVWEQAERVITSISDPDVQAEALSSLGQALAQAQLWSTLLRVVQRSWLRSETREIALVLLSLTDGFLPLEPEIGNYFYEAFPWVDHFLRG